MSDKTYGTTFTCDELIDLDKAKIIRDNWSSLHHKVGKFIDSKKGYQYVPLEAAFTIVDKYCKAKSKTSKVSYKYSGKKSEGRQFSVGASLQNLSRPFRHTIAGEFYDDLDVVNCHPEIFQQLSHKLGLDTTHLRYYNENRQKCLQTLMDIESISRDDAKRIMLSIMNGGTPEVSTLDGLGWLKSYYDQCLTLRGHILSLKEYKPYLTAAKRNKTSGFNVEGTAINHVFLKFENQALMTIIDYCRERGIRIGALCYDGLMMYKDPSRDNEKVERELEVLIRDKTGFNLALAIKPMTEAFSLEGFDQKGGKSEEDEDEDLDNSDLEMSSRLVKEMNGRIKVFKTGSTKRFFIWNEETRLWDESVEEICRDVFLKGAGDSKRMRSNAGRNAVWKESIGSLIDLSFEGQLDFIGSRYIPVSGRRVYNMETGEFRDRVMGDYFSYEIDRSFVGDTSRAQAYMRELFDDEWERANKIIGYCWTPETSLKKCFIFIGGKDGGKSTFMRLTQLLMKRRFKILNERALFETRNSAVHNDEFAFAVSGSTLSFCSESKPDQLINEKVVKDYVGGDGLAIRECRGSTRQIVCYSKPVLSTNNHPKVSDDPSILDKLEYLRFQKTFERSPDNIRKMESLESDREFLDQLFSLQMLGAKMFYDTRTIGEDVEGRNLLQGQDPVGLWVNERCNLSNSESVYSTTEAWADFQRWVQDQDESPIVIKLSGFRDRMKGRFTVRKARYRGQSLQCYMGLERAPLRGVESDPDEAVN